jgi:hypothetical protein
MAAADPFIVSAELEAGQLWILLMAFTVATSWSTFTPLTRVVVWVVIFRSPFWI